MQRLSYRLLLAFVVLAFSLASALAIEGLTLSLQSSNVVLRWPSMSGETYIIQYRPSLGSNDGWQTLTTFYPPDEGTNITTFVHTNAACVPPAAASSGGGSTDSAEKA